MKKHQAPSVTLSLIGLIIIGIALAQHSSQAAGEKNWPQWRGPYQTGLAMPKTYPPHGAERKTSFGRHRCPHGAVVRPSSGAIKSSSLRRRKEQVNL